MGVGDIPSIAHTQVSVDSLSWDFHVSTLDDSNITEQPKVCCTAHWLQYANLIVRQSSNLGIRIPLRVWAGS